MLHSWFLFAAQAQVEEVMGPHLALGGGRQAACPFTGILGLAATHGGILGAAGFAICRKITDISNTAM